jgi:osmotically-inducible protein OsmY
MNMPTIPTSEEMHQGQPSDESIRSHIYQFYQANPTVDQKEIRVTVQDGEVTLDGTVDGLPEKRRAREIAETIPGVRTVRDNLVLANFVERTDEELRNEIVNALTRDAFVENVPALEIYVSGGEVRLEGTCKTWAEKDSIGDVVEWTPGVRSVSNRIHPTEEASDLVEGQTAFHNKESL